MTNENDALCGDEVSCNGATGIFGRSGRPAPCRQNTRQLRRDSFASREKKISGQFDTDGRSAKARRGGRAVADPRRAARGNDPAHARPVDAGRIIAEAITHAEGLNAAAQAPEGKAEPKSEIGADPKAEAKAKTPPDLTSKITK
jgi:hypothetical protein